MKSKYLILPIAAGLMFSSFKSNPKNGDKDAKTTKKNTAMTDKKEGKFQYVSEQFADLRILRYEIPGFDELSLQQKELLYYLSEAALCGRDINWDQNYKYNLTIRKVLEAIVANYKGDVNSEDYKNFLVYT